MLDPASANGVELTEGLRPIRKRAGAGLQPTLVGPSADQRSDAWPETGWSGFRIDSSSRGCVSARGDRQ